jgi:hypothetical protein
LVRLFDPRRDQWSDHFRFEGGYIEGLSAIGRTTVHLLLMNERARVEIREVLWQRGELG